MMQSTALKRAFLLATCLVFVFFLVRHTSTTTGGRVIAANGQRQDLSSDAQQQARTAQSTVAGDASPLSSSSLPRIPSTGKASAGSASGSSKTRQKPLGDMSTRSLRTRLSYYFPYDPTQKFPNYIWQTWREQPSSSRFGEQFRPMEASWTELHDGFIHEVLTDNLAVNVLRHLYSGLPDVVEAYESLPRPVLKADFFRYLILLARGGIYTDIDTMAIKPAVDWVPAEVPRESYGLVIGIEADPDREDWADWYSRRIQFCQWTIQAKPGHPVLREIVANITEQTLARKRAGRLTHDDVHGVVDFTGPAVWTDTIFAFFNDPRYFDFVQGGDGKDDETIDWRHFTGMKEPRRVGDVIVLPITCFSPGIKTMGAGDDDDPMAYVKHFFEGVWKPDSERHIGEAQ